MGPIAILLNSYDPILGSRYSILIGFGLAIEGCADICEDELRDWLIAHDDEIQLILPVEEVLQLAHSQFN